MNDKPTPIGIFDSGFGGLTIFDKIREALPDYDYIYLGDNARTPYGTRSYDAVYRFTREAVMHLFAEGCPLIILACNIQQRDLPAGHDPSRRVLGVIRPTAEIVGRLTHTGHVGLLGTTGTVASRSYPMEIAKLYPDVTVVGEACPMWVPLVENGEADSPGADYFVQKHIERLFNRDPQIDTVILGCTHYPLLTDKIRPLLAGRPRGRPPQRLSHAPPRDRASPQPTRRSAFPDDRLPRAIRRHGLPLPPQRRRPRRARRPDV